MWSWMDQYFCTWWYSCKWWTGKLSWIRNPTSTAVTCHTQSENLSISGSVILQVSVKIEPSRVELWFSVTFPSNCGTPQSAALIQPLSIIMVQFTITILIMSIITYAVHLSRVWFPSSIPSTYWCAWASQYKSMRTCVCDELSLSVRDDLRFSVYNYNRLPKQLW